ncbi:DUF4307 domain-containing protein [Phycicoccus sp. Soil748]|uniref:DUF4307 domain-containing protein n=1 Tax=Phycicoccus sp. Soil748 TaxID=1736397 RepID=UPI000703AA7A|nr:DUF4307 domain-containing protein [Phycicoccus sp. Soil748]KRE56901.1 hypothetical protein ASG70_00115 [Phycicoccus sp. Soil748]
MPLPRPAPGTGRWWFVGIIGCTIGVGLAVWLGLANSLGAITATDTGYKVLDDRSVRVEFDVHRPAGEAVTCRIQALDATFGVVGVTDVDVPASDEGSVHKVVVVRTASRAVTGVVDSCTAH